MCHHCEGCYLFWSWFHYSLPFSLYKLILHVSCPSPGITYFSREPLFLLLRMVIRNQDLDSWGAHCYWDARLWAFSADRARKYIVYTNLRRHAYLEIFLYVTICTCVKFILMSSVFIHQHMDHSSSLPLFLYKLPLRETLHSHLLCIYIIVQLQHACRMSEFLTPSYLHLPPRASQVKVKVAQLCPTFCYSMDCSPPGSSDRGILQARILEWIAIPFSGDLPNSGGKPRSPPLQADSSPSEPPGKPRWVSGKESACGAEGCGFHP